MKHFIRPAIGLAFALTMTATTAQAATIAQWTFEGSVPATSGPHAAEIGSGSATGFHSTATVYSNPVGNGSAESFSSTAWSVGDYYQFQISTLTYEGIQVAWDQTSSNTGPGQFKLAYSTDGSSFTDFSDYAVLANASPNPVWNSTTPNALYTLSFDLSSITALDNQVSVYFRLIDRSTVAANGGTVASGGTSRVDNFVVTGEAITAVPVPAAVWLLGSALVGLGTISRRRRQA
jgi:hypothetical protein